MKISSKILIVAAILLAAANYSIVSGRQKISADNFAQVATTQVKHPEWSKNQNIYEINVRQHTPEGTFAALEAHLPRLKELGAGILWLMPIHPIGELNRKGPLGSYYAVKDYKGVNPDYGTDEDFKRFVKKAHEVGLYVIIDWVPTIQPGTMHW
jgi:cyclomaltodextrinase